MHAREDELKARRDARIETLDDRLEPGEQLYVDGRPVDSARVIVLRGEPQAQLDRQVGIQAEEQARRRLRSDPNRRAMTAGGAGRRTAEALGPQRAQRPTELSLYRRDASNMEGGDVGRVPPGEHRRRCRRAFGSLHRHGVPFVPRGSGTGLAGGAVPLDGAVVIATSKMDAILSVDTVNRQAWVQPGVLNLDLTRQLEHFGLHFAPDPSSQQTCSIGGNVANNSGGPHCLAEGVTASHMLAVEVVLPDGTLATLGGEDPEPAGYDLRGAFVGSEGMLGIATAVCVKLTQNPPAVRTLADGLRQRRGRRRDGERHHRRRHGAGRGGDDGPAVPAGGRGVHQRRAAGRRGGGAARRGGRARRTASTPRSTGSSTIARAHGVRTIRIAQDDAERALLWKGRKSAFGAIARIKPNYYLHDTVVPRSKLPEVLRPGVRDRRPPRAAGAQRVPRRRRQPPSAARVRRPRARRRRARPPRRRGDRARVGRGRRGAERRARHRPREARLHVVDVLRGRPRRPGRAAGAFDPDRLANPGKVLPSPASCGDIQSVPAGAWV